MEINHPANSILVVSSAEDLLRSSLSDQLKLPLLLLNLAFELIDVFLRAILLFVYENLLIQLRNTVTQSLLFFLSALENLVILLILATLPPHEGSHKLICPELRFRAFRLSSSLLGGTTSASFILEHHSIHTCVLILEEGEGHLYDLIDGFMEGHL